MIYCSNFLLQIYSILLLLSYNQQVTLMTFGYFDRYRYPTKRVSVCVNILPPFKAVHSRFIYKIFTQFPLKVKHDDYSEAEDEELSVFIEEEFV